MKIKRKLTYIKLCSRPAFFPHFFFTVLSAPVTTTTTTTTTTTMFIRWQCLNTKNQIIFLYYFLENSFANWGRGECDHSRERYCAVLSYGADYYDVQGVYVLSLWIWKILKRHQLNESFRAVPFSAWCCLF